MNVYYCITLRRVVRTMMVISLFFLLMLFATPLAAGGGNGNGGGNGPASPGVPYGDIYGDLWLLIRDVSAEGDGAPILFSWMWPDEAYIGEELNIEDGDIPDSYTLVDGLCPQPFSLTPISMPADVPEQFTYSGYVNEYGETVTVYLIPLDDECKIPEVYADLWGAQVMEVELGRLNLARSSQEVIDSSYEEALGTINGADRIGLDPAGRLVVKTLSTENELTEKTIDSPLENIALYQRIMLDGCLSHTTSLTLSSKAIAALTTAELGHLVCSTDNMAVGNADLKSAAAFLGGSGDKSGRYNIDTIIYLNNNLGINKLSFTNKSDGSINIAGYYDFGSFSYERSLDDSPVARLLQPDPERPDVYTLVESVAVFPAVFLTARETTEMPIADFTRAADDALGIIFYIHNFEPPEVMENRLP